MTTHGPADGATFDAARDQNRLDKQRDRVWAVLVDGLWHTSAEFEQRVGDNWASLSARVRDFRKAKFGGHTILRHCIGGGLWEYKLAPPEFEELAA